MAALTENQLEMVRAIAKCDMGKARAAALAALADDTSKKNAYETGRLADALYGGSPSLVKVPHQLKGMVEVIQPESFRCEYYYPRKLEESVRDEIAAMRLVSGELAGMGMRYANATLLHGDPGTGKTELARYVAHSMGLPLVCVNFSHLISSLMGSTGKNMAEVFGFARGFPCVLFVDEIDTVCTKRVGGGDSARDETNRVTVTVMQELDRMGAAEIVMAATNRVDMVDPAMLRRFAKVVEITRYSEQEAREFARRFAASRELGGGFAGKVECAVAEGGLDTPSSIADAATEIAVEILTKRMDGRECDR